MKFNFIHFPTFIISLSIGLFITYLYQPKKHVIYVYPNPNNLNKILYKDNADNCFMFKGNELKCPTNSKYVREYNIQ